MNSVKRRVARSIMAAVGVALLASGVWQVAEHGSGADRVVLSDTSSSGATTGRSTGTTATGGSSRRAAAPSSEPGAESQQNRSKGSAGGSKTTGGATAPTEPSATPARSGGSAVSGASASGKPSQGTVPNRLTVSAIGIDAPVTAKGTQVAYDPWLKATVSQFGVPNNDTGVAWWSDGPAVGAGRGMAVLLGHTTIGGNGVFNKLGQLRPGDAVVVGGRSSDQALQVSKVLTGVSKSDATALQNALQNAPAGSEAALVTCSGDTNSARTSHADNTVVFLKRAS